MSPERPTTTSPDLEKPDNLVAFLEESVERFTDRPLFGVRRDDGSYVWISYGDVGTRIDALRSGLSGLGIAPGDAVGIIANNRPEWAVAAFASYGLGARFVPMYEAELPQTWEFIIRDSSIKVLFVSSKAVMEQLAPRLRDMPSLTQTVLIEGEGPGTMEDLERRGSLNPLPSRHPDPDEVAVLIYTSGTTGSPKGVLLTHGNFTSNVHAGKKRFPEIDETDVCLSILPWAHSFGQTSELYSTILIGGAIGIMGGVHTLLEDFRIVRPTFLVAVPRVFNRVYDGLWARMNREGGYTLKLFLFAVHAAQERREKESAPWLSRTWARTKAVIGDVLVFRKIRAGFGGRLKGVMSGSAAMNPDISRFFFDIGVPVYDCYGLTETSPGVTVSSAAAYRIGSVGRPLDNVRIVIDTTRGDRERGDGEIIVYGPNVMKGYHNRPEETNAVFTEDGGFRTGDRGRIDEDGYLYITGRIKEQYKLENGKYVFPAALEEDIRLEPLVENAMVYGNNRPFNICLIVPDFPVLGDWGQQRGLTGNPEEWIDRADVQEEITGRILQSLKGNYGSYELPRTFLFLRENFTVENGLLTQTMKLKRQAVYERYRDRIEEAYR